ncbi:AEC family transporter [Mycetocola reblochoni]|uniref:Auxin Efflux Carrier n=2 Tax=Mycetocola reblochoni TaxID=331618 RepID=A0A1R4IQB6_9MICO|nr:AEC family transporter [Mycetocola reblochoni]RLP67889.1 AEC family transporter [Mycetocola reblochoni]SJN21433.1 Auxin Efflux Carrier [Mycetocola reblochoni REB411]
MGGVLVGFGIIATVIAVGYLIAVLGIGGPSAGYVLNRVAFFVTNPALLFTVLAHADLRQLFSSHLLVALISAVAMILVYLLLARFVWRMPVPESVIGATASGYVNSNNIGLPVAVYVLGDAQLVAPVLLIQLLLFSPVSLAVLDTSTRGSASLKDILLQPVRNPIIIASLLGVLVAFSGVQLPDAVYAPFELIGGAAIPMVLMAFGMSLRGQRPFGAGSGRPQIAVATVLKVVVMPATAYLIAAYGFGMTGHELFAVVALAALPTAQNVFNFASRYERGETLARDVVLLSTVASVPVLLLVSVLLN